jgi:hypothetical protein
MNDDGDDPWDELLERFREIEPPASVRAANLAAVRVAAAPRVTTGWRHRSVATPVPAALATAALLLVSLTLNLVLWRGQRAPADVRTPANVDGAANPAVESRPSLTASVAMNEPRLEYSETQRYLSGVGVVDRQVSYAIKGRP